MLPQVTNALLVMKSKGHWLFDHTFFLEMQFPTAFHNSKALFFLLFLLLVLVNLIFLLFYPLNVHFLQYSVIEPSSCLHTVLCFNYNLYMNKIPNLYLHAKYCFWAHMTYHYGHLYLDIPQTHWTHCPFHWPHYHQSMLLPGFSISMTGPTIHLMD